MARLRLRWSDARDPRVPLFVRAAVTRRLPEVQGFYRDLGRPQPDPLALGHVDVREGFVLFMDDQLGGFLYDSAGRPAPSTGRMQAIYRQLVDAVEDVDVAVADERRFAEAAEAALRSMHLLPSRPVTIRRIRGAPSAAWPPGIRVVALCTADPHAGVADRGLFGQPRHVRDGWAGAEAWFIHPDVGVDPASPPEVLDIPGDVGDLFEDVEPGQEGYGFVFVEAGRGVDVRCPALPGPVVADAVASYARDGLVERGAGRTRYTLHQGATGTLVFRADASMDLGLAVTLASAWSLVANRGNLFLQGGRAPDDAHQFLITP